MRTSVQVAVVAVVALAAIAALAHLNRLLVLRETIGGGSSGAGNGGGHDATLLHSELRAVRVAQEAQGVDLANVRQTVEAHKLGFDQFVMGLLNGA